MIRSFCRRAIWLDHGRLVQDGPAVEVTDAYQEYLNHPAGVLPFQREPICVTPVASTA